VSGGLAFLVVAVLLSILGSMVLWLRTRKPTSLEHGIDSFSREMDALSPEEAPRGRLRRPADPSGGDAGRR
jgi:hypothetical protein